jgi:hypothetical protein
MTLIRVPSGLELQLENSGGPIELVFSPEVPLGAHLSGAELDGKRVDVQTQENAQDEHANLQFTVPAGKSRCLIRYEGGLSLSVNNPAPLLGEPSKGIKIISVAYKPGSLRVSADVSRDASASTIELRTNEEPFQPQGAKLTSVAKSTYDLIVDPETPGGSPATQYRHVQIVVDFAGRMGKSKPAN